MIIANPIYDTIFKHLLKDLSIAKGFLSVILKEEIIELSFAPRERSRTDIEQELIKDRVRLSHLDFLAEIKTSSGSRKVQIELQKCNEDGTSHRFRSYIGGTYVEDKEHYDHLIKAERLSAETEDREVCSVEPPEILPVVPIIILGFKLEPKSVLNPEKMITCFKRVAVNPNDNDKPTGYACRLADELSHDLYIVQIPHLPTNPKTDIEEALSVFEQRFLCEDHWKKDYNHELEKPNPLLTQMLKRLKLLAEDKEIVKEVMEEEAGELFITNMNAKVRQAEDKANQAVEKANLAEQQKEEALTKLNSAYEALIGNGMPEEDVKKILGL